MEGSEHLNIREKTLQNSFIKPGFHLLVIIVVNKTASEMYYRVFEYASIFDFSLAKFGY